jgi:transcriptional regulator with XRE-family HTH domain
MKIRELGEYIRNQRKGARLSLKSVSAVAGVSIPYLSQIERGLRKPSAEILQAIAKGLRISAETLYVQAGFLEDRPITDVVGAVMSDPALTERHKQALVEIYRAFREETGRVPTEGSGPGTPKTSNRSPRGSGRTSSGRTGARAVPSPHRPPRRPTATDAEKEV